MTDHEFQEQLTDLEKRLDKIEGLMRRTLQLIDDALLTDEELEIVKEVRKRLGD